MKRWLGVLAIALFLTGCSDSAPQEIEDGAVVPTGQNQEQSASALYDAESAIEKSTNGAVQAYLPEMGNAIRMATMGKHILLFSEDSVARFRGDLLTQVAQAQIPGLPMPGSGMLQIKDDGIAYYDAEQNRIVFMNQFFSELGVFSLPEGIVGDTYLTQDWSVFYYCSAAGVHVLDLDTGVSRLLMAQNSDWQGISGGFVNGTVLRCSLLQENGTIRTMLISTETGSVLAEGEYLEKLVDGGDSYYLQKGTDHIFGLLEEQTKTLQPVGNGKLYPLTDSRQAVVQTAIKGGCRLDYYDVDSGIRKASVDLAGIKSIDGAYVANGAVWFTSEGKLYRWQTEQSPVEDENNYTVPWYYDKKPDKNGLAAIGQQLTELEAKFGVEIFYWNEVQKLAPWEYSFTPEYLTQPYAQSISALEKVMAQFPEGFFQKAAERTVSGKLNIVLVRGIYAGAQTDKYTSAPGIQYNLDGNTYIALSSTEDLEQWFYHELGHLIDSRILSTDNSYSQWNNLNPWDFKYDNDYEKNQNRTESKYLEGENRYFVDLYSMSFAVEDRSRIFEYACMPGNEEVFASKYMQKKLKTVCAGIRKAFNLTGETYIWEQYLK